MKRPSGFTRGSILFLFRFLFGRFGFILFGSGFFRCFHRLGFFLFLYRIAESAQFFAQTIICAVGVADGFCFVKMELACFIQEFVADLYGNDFCQEHIMSAQRDDLFYFTFNVHRAFVNDRGIYFFPFFSRLKD